MFHELHHRTLFKSITWLIVGFLVTFGVLYFFTRNAKDSLIDAILIQILKFIFFYIHERIWNKSNYGQEIKISKIVK
jgi:uncharacterized membrane protein